MYRKKGFRLTVIVAAIVAIAALSWAVPQAKLTDDEMVAQNRLRPPGGHLDQNYNQLRYVKTTDYGASWTLGQAGDLSAIAPYDEEAFGDFSAVTMSNGEVCYLIALLTAATPGIYAMAGPAFTPVLVMAQGDNDLSYGYNPGGHTDIGRAPDGSLVGIFWGASAAGTTTVWACKSTNNGASWTAWVVATDPSIPPYDPASYDGYYKMPDRVHNQWAWTLYQEPTADGYEMKTIRFDHTTTNAGTIVPVGNYAGHPFSFMFGGTKPFAYDPANNYAYVSFRNNDATGILIYYSDDAGATWQQAAEIIDAAHRYPSMSLRAATQTPFLAYNETAAGQPGDEQCAFMSYDEIGYGGGSWIDPTIPYQCVTLFDENTSYYNSIYVAQVWWWDANQGVSSFNGCTNFLSGEIIQTSRTTDSGTSWIDMGTRVHYVTNQINAGTMQMAEMVGGENGVAYVIYSGAPGITDEQIPTVTGLELLSVNPPDLGPYTFKAFYDDNIGIDTTNPAGSGPWINWGETPDPAVVEVANWDFIEFTAPERQAGWYHYTVPGGWSQGDTIWIYADGYDLSGNYGNTPNDPVDSYPYIVAGVEWQGVRVPQVGMPSAFALLGNYPNPFNPSTTIEFSLPVETVVSLSVFNTLGQMVKTVVDNQVMGAGTHGVFFDASDLPTGVYLYRLTAGDFSDTQKMLLVK